MKAVYNSPKGSGHVTGVFSRSRLLFYIFTALIFVAALIYFSSIKKDILLLKKVNYFWLAAAVAGQGLTYLAAALAYRNLLGSLRAHRVPGILDWMEASIVSLFLNQAVPSAGLSGNAFIFNFLSKKNIPSKQIITLIIIELLSFYAGMELIILSLLAASFIVMKVPPFFPSILAAGVLVFLVFSLGIGFVGRKKSMGWLYSRLTRIKWIKKLLSRERSIDASSAGLLSHEPDLRQRKRAITMAILFQVAVVLADSFTIFAIFEGLGRTISFHYIVLGLVCTKIISILPFLPGGLILYESSMTYAYVSLGSPLGMAVIVTMVYRLLSFWLPIPVGLALYGKLSKDSTRVQQ